jgi:hypothetical protein
MLITLSYRSRFSYGKESDAELSRLPNETKRIRGDGIATQIEMDGRNPPTFKITGSHDGSVRAITVVEIRSDGETPVWRLEPAETEKSLSAVDLPTITYGSVPPKFRQVKSTTPPLLASGHTYALIIRGIYVTSVRRTFRVVGETTIPIPVQ